MTQLYVVGGRQKPDVGAEVAEWHHYAAGLVVSLDTSTGEVNTLVDYVSPPEACPDESPSVVFKTATIRGDRAYVPTQTELLVYEVPSFRQVGYVSLPRFNDVHHVTPGTNGTMFVANTGLDTVLEVGHDGTVVREWSTVPEDTWSRFSRDVDYRKVPTTKPHKSHPNHVWFLDGEVWVTRCDQKDAFCLTREQAPVPIADRWIHDGLVHGSEVYFTSVNGHVIVMDAATRQVTRRYDLNAIAGAEDTLGWCRGIEVLDDGLVAVGFSRLRQTKWKENVRWVKQKLGRDVRATRVAIFDLNQGALVWEQDLEPAGLNVIFSIHRV